ncbi:PfkB family carbohydrate kinase [Nocardia lijiangensis]|uniref:PfkB family carbohydrate kinase n=1 Tax=Nocardia lijiangensis TaxID=299618 RepID=UPI00082B0CC2|nr:PfkB family carbohydrate kinase [Nocardia lijiangensis]
MAPQNPRTIAIRDILTRLCTYYGLRPERLGNTEIDVTSLLELPVVRQYAQRTGLPAGESLLPVVRETAQRLSPTDRLIADSALALGLFRDNPPDGIDLSRLYADNLGPRREYLVEHWRRLHRALGVDHIPEPPTVKRLRTSSEGDTFTVLADLLTADAGYVIPQAMPSGKILVSLPDSVQRPKSVTVVGDAVIDHLYRVDGFPAADRAARGSFTRPPGGKGLNRAVAAARLGLDVALVSAVGNDKDGAEILDFLTNENVRCDLVKVVDGGRSPVTAVIMDSSGETRLIGCKDDRVKLEVADLQTGAVHAALASSEVVLLTLEHPRGVAEQVLAMVRGMRPRPQVIVCPSPSPAVPQDLYQYLEVVDYLVGSPSELRAMLPVVSTDSTEESAKILRGLGVRAVCAIDGFRCSVRSERLKLDVGRFQGALKNSAGAAAAFSAALACRVVETGGELDAKDVIWATAAMIPTQQLGAVPRAMPDKDRIDDVVRQGNKQ